MSKIKPCTCTSKFLHNGSADGSIGSVIVYLIMVFS